MRTLVRRTLTGNEYWDAELKKTVFVPAGEEPSFEVTENSKAIMIGVDLTSAEDITITDGIDLEEMNANQLLEYAEQYGVTVPGTMKKEDTIRKFIADAVSDTE